MSKQTPEYVTIIDFLSTRAGYIANNRHDECEYTWDKIIWLMELRERDNAAEVERLKAEDAAREAMLKEMFRLTGLHPKLIGWTNKIQELEFIIHGLEEGSAEWEQRSRTAESFNTELVETLKEVMTIAGHHVGIALQERTTAALSRAEKTN